MMELHVVILAAGQGKRMVSKTPKVLHPLGGKPLLMHVVEAAQALVPSGIHVVVGHEGAQVRDALSTLPVQWVEQDRQLGTGHAVLQALPLIPPQSIVLILSGDVPLVDVDVLRSLILTMAGDAPASLALLLAVMDDPRGLGRIVRNTAGSIQAIVEEKDATQQEKLIHEIYTGICCSRVEDLARWLPSLEQTNAQGEYYLTDIIAVAVAEKKQISSIQVTDPSTVQGVNNRAQLAGLERIWQLMRANQVMEAGVTLADPARFDVRGALTCAQDVFIDVDVVVMGDVKIGEGSEIGPYCVLNDVVIGKNCKIKAHSVLEGCVIADACEIGPFARLRPGTVLSEHCKVGNFVEMKNAVFGVGSKASHLSYLGDLTVGEKVNIGAGTITCNYDGANKHQTVIEDGAFIGSDTQLVAPVTVGKDATIAAGSTIRKNAPPGELTMCESKQKTVYGWKRREKVK